MKKVLVLSPEIPFPTFKGNQHRIDATIKILLGLGVEVSIAILNSNQKKRSSISVVRDLKNHYPNLRYIEVRKNTNFIQVVDNKTINGIYKKVIANVDHVLDQGQISNLDICPLKYRRCVSELIDKFKPTHILVNYAKLTRAIPKNFKGVKILDCHDVQTNILKEGIKAGVKKSNIDIQKYLKDELNLLNSYDVIVSINKNETKQLVDFGIKPKIITIPGFNHIKNLYQKKLNKKYDILFVGSASPFNVEGVMKFIAKCYPIIKKQIPNVKFAIAGDVSTCSAVKKVNDSTIDRLGRVDNLEELYADSKIVVSSIISGAGMKVKNIEALSFGMPLVATPFSMDGIDAEHNISALIQEDWVLFAKDVVALLKNQNKRDMLSKNAENLARVTYSKEMARNKYKAIFFNNLDMLTESCKVETIIQPSVMHKIKSEITPNKENKRIKSLIFSTDAVELIDYNISLARSLNEVNVYSEFVKMDHGCENRFYKNGFLVHAIRDKLTKERRVELKKKIKINLEGNEIVGCKYKGIDISDEINIYKKMFPQHFNKSIEDVVVHGILILEQINILIEKIKPDFLVGWNGNGPHFIFLMKVAAKLKNIPIFHVERGLLPRTFVVDTRGVNFKSSVAGSYLPLLNEKERKWAQDYLEYYRNNSSTIVNTQEKLNLDKASILSRLNLDVTKEYIFFPMQIEGDSNIILNSPKYKKMSQVISDLVYVASKLNIYVICRQHPENNMQGILDEVEEIGNLIIDNSIHIHDMLKNSIANIVINSTVGLESILLSRPTIALGHSVYSAKNITFDAYSKEDILNALISILSNNYSSKLLESRTEALIVYLFNNQLLRLDVDPAENKDLLINLLERNGIHSDLMLGKPKPPLLASKYIERLKKFQKAIMTAQCIEVYNELPENTVQYLNGSKKPIINQKMIREYFKSKYDKKITIKKTPFNVVNINPDVLSLIVVKSGNSISNLNSEGVYWIDEYFELI